MNQKANEPKMLIFGIDGADWQVLKPLIKQGLLPNLAAMMEKGAYGDLKSTYPCNSISAWASFQTGLNPGKHGLFDFFQSGRYTRGLVDAGPLRDRTIWELLGNAGRQVGVINVPATYPPRPVNGFLIPGMMTPSKIEPVPTYPADLLKRHQEYQTEIKSNIFSKDFSPEAYLEALIASVDRRGRNALELVKSHPWQFLCMVFTEPDRLQHWYMKYIDRCHPEYDSNLAKRFKPRIDYLFQRIDQLLGEFRFLAGEKALTLVVSDHGFKSINQGHDLGAFLIDRGYLKLITKQKKSIMRSLIRFGQKVDIFGLRRLISAHKRGQIVTRASNPKVDWQNSMVYPGSFSEQAIYINLQGREPNGMIKMGKSYNRLITQLTEDLYSWRDLNSGNPVVGNVIPANQVIKGKFAWLAPDLFLEAADESHLFMNGVRYPDSLKHDQRKVYGMSGHHRQEGVFIAQGPQIQKLGKIDGLQIIDICPTVLYGFNVPIPQDIDGQVLSWLFTEEFQESTQEKSAPPIEAPSAAQQPAYNATEEEIIKKRLQDLGYL